MKVEDRKQAAGAGEWFLHCFEKLADVLVRIVRC